MEIFSTRDERGYNQIFRPFGSTNFRAERRYDWFRRELEKGQARRVIEIGCGTGEAAAYLASHTSADVTAIDMSEKFLTIARERHRHDNLKFINFDLRTGDIGQLGKFNFIYGNGILHHLVPDLDQILKTMRSALDDNGRMAFIEPNYLNPYCRFIFGTKIGRRLAKQEPQEKAFKPNEIRDALRKAEWRDINVQTRDFLIPGLPTPLIKPVLAIEPIFESTPALSWLAQSHFISAHK